MTSALSKAISSSCMVIAFCLSFSSLPALAGEYQGIARVIISSGDVVAESKNEPARKLGRRAQLHMGDTVKTGENSKVKLRFVDDAIVVLDENSELVIEQYRYQHDARSNSTVMRLVDGGFRTITGRAAQQNPEAYELNTTLATIGIRGTDYEVSLEDGVLSVAVWSGGVRLSNEAGQLDLGADVKHRFGVVPGPEKAPRGQHQLPEPLHEALPFEATSALDGDSDLTTLDSDFNFSALKDDLSEAGLDDDLALDLILEARLQDLVSLDDLDLAHLDEVDLTSFQDLAELTEDVIEEARSSLDESKGLPDEMPLETLEDMTIKLEEALENELPLRR